MESYEEPYVKKPLFSIVPKLAFTLTNIPEYQLGNSELENIPECTDVSQKQQIYEKAIQHFTTARESGEYYLLDSKGKRELELKIATSSKKLAMLYTMSENTTENVQNARSHFRTAFQHFSLAWNCLSALTTFNEVNEGIDACLTDATDWTATLSARFKEVADEEFIKILPACSRKHIAMVTHVNFLLKLANQHLSKESFRETLRYISKCESFLEDLPGSNDKDAKEVRNKVSLTKLTAEAMQSKKSADEMLKSVNTWEIERILDATDLLRGAFQMISGKNPSLEGELLCKLGHLYCNVLKRKEKASMYYRKAGALIEKVPPDVRAEYTWIDNCQSYLSNLEIAEEENRKKSMKDPDVVVLELKEDLDLLNKIETKPVRELLTLVYRKWPPKQSDMRLDMKLSERKMMQKAVIHYHPDRQKSDNQKWSKLCEEISKVLTSRYEELR